MKTTPGRTMVMQHTVDTGSATPIQRMMDKIFNGLAVRTCAVPKTKKDVRSSLITGYYRKFIPNHAATAAPLTDLTRKKAPNHIEWNDT